MKKIEQAILDTGVLRSLYYLQLTQYLSLFYEKVLIPRAVEREFFAIADEADRNQRFAFLMNAYESFGAWLSRCNNYDEEQISLFLATAKPLEKKLHRGEAEVFVQNQTLGNTSELLIDEKIARRYAKNIKIQPRGTLYILAKIDLNLKGCNYFASARQLKDQHGVFLNENIIIQVYEDMQKEIL